jgi:anti-sigma B factor antagonist
MLETENGRDPIEVGLTIATEPVRGGIRVVPRGELDLGSSSALQDALGEAERSHNLVVLDLRELSFMDSTGLHALIIADERMREHGVDLVIVRGNSQVGKLLDLTQASQRLHVISEPRESFSG